MKEVAENKARRGRSIREAFPAPLNQIALRHVDTVQSLDRNRKAILAKALAKAGVVSFPRKSGDKEKTRYT